MPRQIIAAKTVLERSVTPPIRLGCSARVADIIAAYDEQSNPSHLELSTAVFGNCFPSAVMQP